MTRPRTESTPPPDGGGLPLNSADPASASSQEEPETTGFLRQSGLRGNLLSALSQEKPEITGDGKPEALGKLSRDPELAALESIRRHLEGLDLEGRARVLAWLISKYAIKVPAGDGQ